MMRKCLYCEEREFEPQFDTDAYCSTYCQNAWWMTVTAPYEWEQLEQSYRDEWNRVVRD